MTLTQRTTNAHKAKEAAPSPGGARPVFVARRCRACQGVVTDPQDEPLAGKSDCVGDAMVVSADCVTRDTQTQVAACRRVDRRIHSLLADVGLMLRGTSMRGRACA